LITAIGAFAEAFTNPVALAIVMALAFLLRPPWQLRLGASVLGALLALLSLLPVSLPPAESALLLLGSIAAMLLYAEVALHLVLPACRLARRLVLTAWELALDARALLLDDGRLPPAASGPSTGPPHEADEKDPPPMPPTGPQVS
jgi:hypothetical protein